MIQKTLFVHSENETELLTIPFLFLPTEVSVVEIDGEQFNIEDITDTITSKSVTRCIYLSEI